MSLQDTEKKKNSILIYVIIAFLLLGMAGFGVSRYGLSLNNGQNQPVLQAGRAEISMVDYQNALNNNTRILKNQPIEEIQAFTIKQLKNRLALSNYLDEYAFAPDQNEISTFIHNNFVGADGQYSEAVLKEQTGSPNQYIHRLSQQFAMRDFQNAMLESSIISQAEFMPYANRQNLSRDILVAKVSRNAFKADASDQEISDYFAKHKSDFMTDEKVKLTYIDFNPTDIAKKVPISDEEIANAAAPPRRVNYYLFNSEEKADEAYQAFVASKTAKDIESEFKADISDSDSIADITKIADDEAVLSQNAINAIFKLTKIGEITPPIDLQDDGIYLFELTDAGKPKALSEAEKKEIKTTLQRKKSAKQVAEISAKLNKAVYDSQATTLENVAKATGLRIEHSALLGINSRKSILSVDELVKAIMGSDKTLNKLQEPVVIDERVILYQLTENIQPQQKPFADVKKTIKETLIREKIDKQMQAAVDKLMAATETEGLQAAAQKANYPTKAFKDFTGRIARNELLDRVGAIFIQRKPPAALGDKAPDSVKSLLGDSYVYVNTDIRFGKGQAEKNQQLREQLTQEIGSLEFRHFIDTITKQTAIKVRADLLKPANPSEKTNLQ